MQNRYKFAGKKGSGTFSTVVKAERLKDGKLVAIKKLKQKFPTMDDVKHFREIQALRRLGSNPNIVQLLEIIYDPNNGQLSLVFELMNMNLYEWLKIQRTYLLRPVARHIITEIVKSVAYCHEKGVFHRDFKPENVLVKCGDCETEPSNGKRIRNPKPDSKDSRNSKGKQQRGTQPNEPTEQRARQQSSESGDSSKSVVNSVADVSSLTIKLADFGSCRGCYSKPPFTEYVATRWYRSPECILSDGQYGPMMDCWAVGVVAAEVLCLEPLFPGKDERDMINRIVKMVTGGYSTGSSSKSQNPCVASPKFHKYTGGMYLDEWKECVLGQMSGKVVSRRLKKGERRESGYNTDPDGDRDREGEGEEGTPSSLPDVRNPLSKGGDPYFSGWVDSSVTSTYSCSISESGFERKTMVADHPSFLSTYYGPHIPHYETFYSNLEMIMPKIAAYDEKARKRRYGTCHTLASDIPGYSTAAINHRATPPSSNIPPVLELDFLIRLMALSPSNRMTMEDALKHPYIGILQNDYVRPTWVEVSSPSVSQRSPVKNTTLRMYMAAHGSPSIQRAFSMTNIDPCVMNPSKAGGILANNTTEKTSLKQGHHNNTNTDAAAGNNNSNNNNSNSYNSVATNVGRSGSDNNINSLRSNLLYPISQAKSPRKSGPKAAANSTNTGSKESTTTSTVRSPKFPFKHSNSSSSANNTTDKRRDMVANAGSPTQMSLGTSTKGQHMSVALGKKEFGLSTSKSMFLLGSSTGKNKNKAEPNNTKIPTAHGTPGAGEAAKGQGVSGSHLASAKGSTKNEANTFQAAPPNGGKWFSHNESPVSNQHNNASGIPWQGDTNERQANPSESIDGSSQQTLQSDPSNNRTESTDIVHDVTEGSEGLTGSYSTIISDNESNTSTIDYTAESKKSYLPQTTSRLNAVGGAKDGM